MKKMIFALLLGLFFFACNNGTQNRFVAESDKPKPASEGEAAAKANPIDPSRGIGKFTHVELGDKLDPALADAGKKIFDVKCSACHKLTDEKLVGPGWTGVTKRYTAEWIMNFLTNTNEMLEKDPKARAQLEICLVRMPSQNVTDNDARQLFEFMRKNDGVQ